MSIIKEENILCNVEAASKEELLQLMVGCLKQNGYINDEDIFFRDVLKREEEFPTYIGFETGIPHGKSSATVTSGICVCNLKQPIVWTENGDEVKLVILIAVTDEEEGANEHLALLAKLSRTLMHDDFRNALLQETKENIYNLIKEKLSL